MQIEVPPFHNVIIHLVHPHPHLVVSSVVGARVHQHLVVLEDGGALAAAQHPDHPVPLEAGGPLPGEQHLGSLGPAVVLDPPPPAPGAHHVLLVRAAADEHLVPDDQGVGAGVQGVGGQHGGHVLGDAHPVHSGALQPQRGGGQRGVTPLGLTLILGLGGEAEHLGRVQRLGVGLPLHPRVSAHQQPVLGAVNTVMSHKLKLNEMQAKTN